MKLNKYFQILVPKDRKFFPLFTEAAENIYQASLKLKEIFETENYEERINIDKQIKDLEHVGDDITHNIFNELNTTFITPFDREDIQTLTTCLDDVIDMINGVSQRVTLYRLEKMEPEFVQMADLIISGSIELKKAINELKNLKKPTEIKNACIKINEYENLSDDIYHKSLSNLFQNEKNAIELIKKKEILSTLENAIDKMEDVSDVIKTVIIKIS